jgi:two-component system LytT family response regulator
MLKERGTTARIALRSRGRIVFLGLDSVIAVKAAGNRSLLEAEAGSYCVRESISEITTRLGDYGFIQVHRSVVVNGALVEAVEPKTTGAYVIRMKGGKVYDVSRSYKGNLARLAHVWIGNADFRRVKLPSGS